ncbi:MAG: flagellar hook-basal body protein [Oscillospiraceae bacterium]|nr:flagellar hook-basal body protein [Oscillospiraceae bacterium]
MNRGYYIAAQGMINQQRILDAISNNVSNINTAGYRKDEIRLNTFQEQLFLINKRREAVPMSYQTYVDQSKTSLEQGGFEFTDSTFDMGIYGNVYFNVRYNKDGEVYQTRNGQFGLDDEGYLWLGGVGRVQGENGDIYIGHDEFVVTEQGVIMDYDANEIGRLLLTYIPPEADVHKEGDTLFLYDGDEQLPENEAFIVIQGGYEKSNVDPIKELTQAMQAQRMYEASSKILQYFDTINQRAAREIAELG